MKWFWLWSSETGKKSTQRKAREKMKKKERMEGRGNEAENERGKNEI